MALTTSQIVQETDISGVITSAIATTGTTTFTAVLKDLKTGVSRTPQSTTLLWDIDKDNSSHEQILMTSHSTADGVTTFTINTSTGRGIPKYGTGAGSSTGSSHVVGASIGCVSTARPLNILANEAAAKGGDTLTGPLTGPVYADATARDAAITVPTNGMSAYLTAEGKWTDYVSGSWQDRASGTNPNWSTTVAGKAERSTTAEIDADTETGGTGAALGINPADLATSKYGTRLPSAVEKTYLTDLQSSGTTVTEIDQALDGISANVTAANLSTLTAGVASFGDSFHSHMGELPAPLGYYTVPMIGTAYNVTNYTAAAYGASSDESSANGCALIPGTSNYLPLTITDFVFVCRARYQFTGSTETVDLDWGLDGDTASFTTSGAYNAHGAANCIILALNGATNKLYTKVWNGSTFTNTDLSTTLAKNTTYTFRIEKTSTYIKFYVDGVLKTTQTTNIPANIGAGSAWYCGTGKVETTATANNHGSGIYMGALTYKTS